MGFGIIFIGYIFTVFDMGFILNEALSLFVCKAVCCAGYAVLIIGLSGYARYSKIAKRSLIPFSALLALQTANAAVQGLWFFGAIEGSKAMIILYYLFPAVAVLYALSNLMLFFAIRGTAIETECPKVLKKANGSIAAAGAFSILNIVASLPVDFGDAVGAIRYVVFLVITAINAVTLYSAYMRICLDTDLEKERAEAEAEALKKKK